MLRVSGCLYHEVISPASQTIAHSRVEGASLVPRGGRDALRVVLGEDDFLDREGIASVLDRLEGIELVASCRDLESLRTTIDRTSPDVVVTDVRLPPGHGDEGVQLAAELRATHPKIGLVLLSERADPSHALGLFAEGSFRRAFLLKERLREPVELARAIQEVAGGGALVDPRVVDELLAAERRRAPSPLAALTPREHDILGLIAEGCSNSAIADRFGISKRGVERHINAIFGKLDLGESEDVSRRVRAALLFLASEGRLLDGAQDGTRRLQ
jgi:DNA-binding NarL/FixJ family response regulator